MKETTLQEATRTRQFTQLFGARGLLAGTTCRCGHTAAAHADLSKGKLRDCMHCACKQFVNARKETDAAQANLPFGNPLEGPQMGTANRETGSGRQQHPPRHSERSPQLLQRQEQTPREARRPRRNRSAGAANQNTPSEVDVCTCTHTRAQHGPGPCTACDCAFFAKETTW